MRLVCLCTFALSLAAQDGGSRRAAYPGIFGLIERARAAPPEFAARALLHLLDAGAVPGLDWQTETAQEALTLAASATHPAGKRLAPGMRAVDNGAMLWNAAFRQGLDRLTLSLRAIDHLRQRDVAAARKAFQQLPRPAPGAQSCADALLPATAAWFQTAARLQLDPLPIVQSIQSHGEIAPAIDLIFQHRNTPEELDTLAGAIGQKLRELTPNDRPFNAALFDTPRKLEHLLKVLQSRQRPTAALADGWSAWMRAGLEVPACQETREAGPQQQARQDAFDLFNRAFETPLTPELLKPSGTAEPTALQPFADSEAAREQNRQFRELLFGPEGRGLSQTEKETPEWRERMQKFIQSIESRTRTADESNVEFFYRQSQLWTAVLMAVPPGPSRDRAQNEFVAFLLQNSAHIDPLVWFSQVVFMTELNRGLHGAEFAKTLESLRLTGHPVLQLYADLEDAFPTRPTSGGE